MCVCVPPQMLVTASRALLLKQWDWRQAQCARSWRAVHTVPVASMTFDSTSTLLATGQQLQGEKNSVVLLCFCLIFAKQKQAVSEFVVFLSRRWL